VECPACLGWAIEIAFHGKTILAIHRVFNIGPTNANTWSKEQWQPAQGLKTTPPKPCSQVDDKGQEFARGMTQADSDTLHGLVLDPNSTATTFQVRFDCPFFRGRPCDAARGTQKAPRKSPSGAVASDVELGVINSRVSRPFCFLTVSRLAVVFAQGSHTVVKGNDVVILESR